jgi:hypothetical protein
VYQDLLQSLYLQFLWVFNFPFTGDSCIFTPFTISNSGLASNMVYCVWGDRTIILAGTDAGLSVTLDNGITWSSYSYSNGLGSTKVNDIIIHNNIVYIATEYGLSVYTQ